MASSSSPEPVQPSPPLLAALHRRLRDPSPVSSFERRRPQSATGSLVRPRWTLRRPGVDGDGSRDGGGGVDGDGSQDGGGDGAGAADKSDAKKADGNGGQGVGRGCTASNNAGGARGAPSGPSGAATAATSCNALPRRSYLDLRLQQNRTFADAQFIICRTRLAAYLPSSNPGRQKHISSFRSALAEGLAACPTHEGLLRAEREWKARMQEEKEGYAVAGGDGGTNAAQFASRPNVATPRANGGISLAKGDNPAQSSLQPRKGAEGRARAAMQDALTERTFLLGDGDAAPGEKAAGIVRYPLLAEADTGPPTNDDRRERDNSGGSDDESSSSSSEDSRRRRRHRKRSRRRRKKHKRRGKRRRREEEDGHRSKGERKRSRDRSRSRSRSSSMSSRSSSHRRRKRRKEKKRRRKHRHRSRSERHSDDEGESENSAEGPIKYVDADWAQHSVILPAL